MENEVVNQGISLLEYLGLFIPPVLHICTAVWWSSKTNEKVKNLEKGEDETRTCLHEIERDLESGIKTLENKMGALSARVIHLESNSINREQFDAQMEKVHKSLQEMSVGIASNNEALAIYVQLHKELLIRERDK